MTLRDFRVGLSDTTVRSGPVSFDIRNLGPSTHEFVVIRTDLESAHLPIAADGLSVDEDSSLLQPVEEDPNLDIGDASVLEARLPPGHYVMFCNLEGHYLGGMHVGFSVR